MAVMRRTQPIAGWVLLLLLLAGFFACVGTGLFGIDSSRPFRVAVFIPR